MSRNKLLLIELNEVPFRVLDTYRIARPGSKIARLLSKSEQYTTVTHDSLALDPWISWPTLHRGVTDETHQILHLGQVLDEVDSRFPPIWRLLRDNGRSVGVFGSLHSSNIPTDCSQYSFYLPDYFDDKSFAHPRELLPFQDLNIMMTRQSARNVSRKLPIGAAVKVLGSSWRLGLSANTLLDCATHLAKETFDRSLRIRRRAYQPLIMGDLFVHQLETKEPDFATFYTNHVAAAMHRYWGAAFPMDYKAPMDSEWIRKYADEISFALGKFDKILDRVFRFIESRPHYTMLVASSMGQAAIPAEKTMEFLTITDLGRFMRQLGIPDGNWHQRPAMVPCACVVVDERYRETVRAGIDILSVNDVSFKEDRRPLAPMSYDERERGFFQIFFQYDNYNGPRKAALGGRDVAFEDLGLGFVPHEDGVNCTAQHIREGSLLVYRSDRASSGRRVEAPVSTTDIAPSILRFFDIRPPAYMRGDARLLD